MACSSLASTTVDGTLAVVRYDLLAVGTLTTHAHAHSCGRVFCGDCSAQRRPLPQFGFNEPVRVCDSCALVEDGVHGTETTAGAQALAAASSTTPAASSAPKPTTTTTAMRSPTPKRATNAAGSTVMAVLAAGQARRMRVWSWRLSSVTAVYGRRYLLRHTALEVFFVDGHGAFLNFFNKAERGRVARKLWSLRAGHSAAASYAPRPGSMPGLG